MTKTILVTGGAGYIGSAIVQQLLAEGCNVLVFDDLSSGQKEKIPDGAIFIQGDITHESDLEKVFGAHAIDAVIHCAAKKVMSESEAKPSLYYQTNVGGTLNILSAMEKYSVPQIIFSSTAAVYAPTGATTPVDESAPVAPVSVYGRSKLIAETLIQEFARCHKIKSYTILRYFNVAGDAGLNYKEESPQGVFSHIARSLRDSVPFYIYGTDYDTKDGSGVRDYIHLLDLAHAHLLALTRESSDIFNLGTSTGYTVYELVAAFEAVTGKTIFVEKEERRPGDLAVMLANPSHAHDTLGWTPEKSLKDMVASIVKLYNLS